MPNTLDRLESTEMQIGVHRAAVRVCPISAAYAAERKNCRCCNAWLRMLWLLLGMDFRVLLKTSIQYQDERALQEEEHLPNSLSALSWVSLILVLHLSLASVLLPVRDRRQMQCSSKLVLDVQQLKLNNDHNKSITKARQFEILPTWKLVTIRKSVPPYQKRYCSRISIFSTSGKDMVPGIYQNPSNWSAVALFLVHWLELQKQNCFFKEFKFKSIKFNNLPSSIISSCSGLYLLAKISRLLKLWKKPVLGAVWPSLLTALH